jgi:hypothetical protein
MLIPFMNELLKLCTQVSRFVGDRAITNEDWRPRAAYASASRYRKYVPLTLAPVGCQTARPWRIGAIPSSPRPCMASAQLRAPADSAVRRSFSATGRSRAPRATAARSPGPAETARTDNRAPAPFSPPRRRGTPAGHEPLISAPRLRRFRTFREKLEPFLGLPQRLALYSPSAYMHAGACQTMIGIT